MNGRSARLMGKIAALYPTTRTMVKKDLKRHWNNTPRDVRDQLRLDMTYKLAHLSSTERTLGEMQAYTSVGNGHVGDNGEAV